MLVPTELQVFLLPTNRRADSSRGGAAMLAASANGAHRGAARRTERFAHVGGYLERRSEPAAVDVNHRPKSRATGRPPLRAARSAVIADVWASTDAGSGISAVRRFAPWKPGRLNAFAWSSEY
jgi:hypothetical protein